MRILKDLATPLAILVLAGVLAFNHLHPSAPAPAGPAVNAKALGKAYAPVLATSYADAWDAAAEALTEGKSVADAQAVHQEVWKGARVKAFRAEVQPSFNLVLPEGTEPASAEKRSQVAELWKGFAVGLRGGAGH